MSAIVMQFLTGWRRLLVAALIGSAVVGPVAWQIRGWQAALLVANAHAARDRAEKELSDLRATVANNVAELERLRADEQAKALAASKAQARRLLDLQARLAESERERADVSSKLREELTHASTADAHDLGPVVLRYLERVRVEQSTQ